MMGLLQEAERARVEIVWVTDAEIERMAPSQRTQGIVANTQGPRLVTVDQILDAASRSDAKPFLVALDQVQDPHNLGALLAPPKRRGCAASWSPSDTLLPFPELSLRFPRER